MTEAIRREKAPIRILCAACLVLGFPLLIIMPARTVDAGAPKSPSGAIVPTRDPARTADLSSLTGQIFCKPCK
jgi:hypothetical protein